jgi:hypothetical protein
MIVGTHRTLAIVSGCKEKIRDSLALCEYSRMRYEESMAAIRASRAVIQECDRFMKNYELVLGGEFSRAENGQAERVEVFGRAVGAEPTTLWVVGAVPGRQR